MAKIEPYIKIYKDKSVIVSEDGDIYEFEEGKLSNEAKKRYSLIKKSLEEGYFEAVILESIKPDVEIGEMAEEHTAALDNLVDSVTSEVGRAIIGLTSMQLTLKSIDNNQSIRLHKGSSSKGSFSWKEGIPMRVLDKNYITPLLRKYGLLKLNADGFMMTRTLAENYPYSKLYKAAIRGAKEEWMDITEWIEADELNALDALKYFIGLLNNKTEEFNVNSNEAIDLLNKYFATEPRKEDIRALILEYVENSTYSARLFEITIHAFYQALDEMKCLGYFLKPLSQMRSANKKHGNIGDIELTVDKGAKNIVEAWDAKYGKNYFRDEIEELNDKLEAHPEAELVGFISNQVPDLKKEITDRVEELNEKHDIEIEILSFNDWSISQLEDYLDDGQENEFHNRWIIALIESIAQRRREYAPIDEPTIEWVTEFIALVKTKI